MVAFMVATMAALCVRLPASVCKPPPPRSAGCLAAWCFRSFGKPSAYRGHGRESALERGDRALQSGHDRLPVAPVRIAGAR